MPNSDQVLRADDESLPTFQSCHTFGMDSTATLALGSPLLSVASAASMLPRNAVTDVMPDSVLVQASLAPIRMVTYAAPCPTAVAAWPFMSATLAPDRASL